MASTVETPPAHTPARRGLAMAAQRPRPLRGFELWAWLFMRLSGIALLVLAVGHVLIMHVVDEGIERVDFGFVAVRWQQPFWRIWDWLLLSLALLHGVNGLRNIIQDYVRKPGARTALNWLFSGIGTAIFLLGTYVVLSFDPSKWPGFGG